MRSDLSNLAGGGAHEQLVDQLRASGVLVVSCGLDGAILSHGGAADDWLAGFLTSGATLRRALVHAVQSWMCDGAVEPKLLFSGVWGVPVASFAHRQVTSFTVALIPTDSLANSNEFDSLCRASSIETDVALDRLANERPISENEVARFVQLIDALFRLETRVNNDEVAMESVGQELAESYEEISLLYTMIQSITSVDRPDRLITIACEELRNTLPYDFVGALMVDDPDQLSKLAGCFIHSGECAAAGDGMRDLMSQLLTLATPNAPIVVQSRRNPDHAPFTALGRSPMVHPIAQDGRLLGIFVAAAREDNDGAASSADLKLLGAAAIHTAIFIENTKLYDDLNATLLGTLEALTASIDAKDRYTCGHSRRVAHLTCELAHALGHDEIGIGRARIAGLVHDVGKIGVPEAVLTKPGKLSEEEFGWIRRHPEMGAHILRDIPQFRDLLPGVRHHHERWDGTGYPDGLKGESIPMIARLISLADAFDAMSSDRTYRARLTRERVLEEIKAGAGVQFDPELVPVMLGLDFTEFDRMIDEHHDLDEEQAA